MGEDVSRLKEDFQNGRIKAKDKKATTMLDQYSRDLTELARNKKLDPVIGREEEIQRVIQILSRRTKNNPCLIGEPGVGKTAVVEGLALRIVEGEVPSTIKDKRLVTLDLSGMVAGSKYRGEFEERIKRVIAEVRNAGNILLFLDEIHTIIGAGGAEGAIDASNILKPSLARGEIQLIGATTLEEYRKHIEKDAALERRFQPVKVEEPTEDEAIDILMGLRPKYEEHHNVVITDDAVRAAVKLSKRYINDRFLPDKAIDLIDEASSRTRLEAFVVPKDIKKLETQIDELSVKKEQAIKSEKYDEAAELKKQQTRKKNRLEKLRTSWQESIDGSDLTVDEEQIAKTVSMWTKIPVAKIAEAESEKLMNLEKMLHNRVIGQDEAVTAVAKAIRRGRVGLKDPNRPIGSFSASCIFFINAPLPTLTSSTIAPAPAAIFLLIILLAISGMLSTMAVTSLKAYIFLSAGARLPVCPVSASPISLILSINSSSLNLVLKPLILSSLSIVPPVLPSPRPLILATLPPQAATIGASISVVLSPTPPVLCLSTLMPPISDKSIISPLCAIASVRLVVSS